MPARTQTTVSTPRLSELARVLVYPEGIVSTGWPRIERRLADMAIRYDTWQQGAARLILGRDKDGRYVATIGGVTMSLPRQIGKTFTIGSLLIAMCVEYPGLRVVWTSHHLRTTTNTFRSMQSMVRRKKIAPHLAHNGIRTANGEQEIRFANGSIIMFGARERGFGVGIDAIDVMVCDEAQRLTSRALADMAPTTNQAQHLHGALLFFIGTPPRPDDAGDEFAARRRKALAGEMLNGIYIEAGADADGDFDSPKQWVKANWSYPHRTPHESMLRLRENLTDPDDWRREAMGVWDSTETSGVFTAGAWPRCASEKQPGKPAALGIASDVDQVWLSLGAASSEDFPHVGAVLRVRANDKRDEFVSEVRRIQREHDIPVAIDAKGPAGVLIPDLEAAGVLLTLLGLEDNVQACSELVRMVDACGLRHGDYPDLNAAVDSVGWRKVGDRRVFARRSGEMSMLEAVAFALWASKNPAAVPAEPSAYFV